MAFYLSGHLSRTFGVRGELVLKLLSEDPDRFKDAEFLTIRKNNTITKHRLTSCRPKGRDLIVLLEGIASPERAQDLCGSEVLVSESNASKKGKDEYYHAELEGCSVWYQDILVGKVRLVIDNGAHPVLECVPDEGKAILVPFVKPLLVLVDIENQKIVVNQDPR